MHMDSFSLRILTYFFMVMELNAMLGVGLQKKCFIMVQKCFCCSPILHVAKENVYVVSLYTPAGGQPEQ